MPAYYDEEEDFAVDREGKSLGSRVSTFFGAVAAIGLIASGGYWAYTLSTRDASEVPVIRAAATPAKTVPVEPGGEVTPHQDITAFEVAEEQRRSKSAAATAPRPASPAEEDLPMSQIAAVSPVPPESIRPLAEAGLVDANGAAPARRPSPVAVHTAPMPSSASAGRAGSAAGEQVAALNGVGDVLSTNTDDEEIVPPRVERLIGSEFALLATQRPPRVVPNVATPVPAKGVGSEFAPAYSPFVSRRPSDLAERMEKARNALARSDASLVARAERSKIQIQLGAFPKRATIEEEWRRISEANGDVLGTRALAVQQTISGGTTYYRLRVGPFRDGHEANIVCQALKARGYDCLVAINTERRG